MAELSHAGSSAHRRWQGEPLCAHAQGAGRQARSIRSLGEPASILQRSRKGSKARRTCRCCPGRKTFRPSAKEGITGTIRCTRCMPPGVPRINMTTPNAPHPFKIVQTPMLVVLLYETSANSTFRQVFLDGRPFPKGSAAHLAGIFGGPLGRSTLVVDTAGSMAAPGWIPPRVIRKPSPRMLPSVLRGWTSGIWKSISPLTIPAPTKSPGELSTVPSARRYRSDRDLLRKRKGSGSQEIGLFVPSAE